VPFRRDFNDNTFGKNEPLNRTYDGITYKDPVPNIELRNGELSDFRTSERSGRPSNIANENASNRSMIQ